jgi:hypothetical protein
MHLVICPRPQEPLEHAPRTALLEETRGTESTDVTWDGFWSGQSDDYYVRCTSRDGATQWFRVEDDVASAQLDAQDVLPIKSAIRGRVALIVAQSPNGRRMLVGSARRIAR